MRVLKKQVNVTVDPTILIFSTLAVLGSCWLLKVWKSIFTVDPAISGLPDVDSLETTKVLRRLRINTTRQSVGLDLPDVVSLGTTPVLRRLEIVTIC